MKFHGPIFISIPSKTGGPPNRPRLEKLGNVFDLAGACDMKYDKIGDFDGDKLAGNMRGGVVLPRGVWGSIGDVGEPEEVEDEMEAERRREWAEPIGIGWECSTES